MGYDTVIGRAEIYLSLVRVAAAIRPLPDRHPE
jgi:hypothetical protein